MFKIIACINTKMVLGKNNELLYHIKNDLQNFKRMTTNNIVVMGRKTFESLPYGALPNRMNIVITSNKDYKAEGCIVLNSLEEAFRYCNTDESGKDWYLIGGASLYKEALEKGMVDMIYLTEVFDDTDGDVFFPNFNKDERFELFYKSETQFNTPPYTFSIYKLSH